jgi:hypothetical protein
LDLIRVLYRDNWHGSVLGSDLVSRSYEDNKNNTIVFPCQDGGVYSLTVQKAFDDMGALTIQVVKQGIVLNEGTTEEPYGVVSIIGRC